MRAITFVKEQVANKRVSKERGKKNSAEISRRIFFKNKANFEFNAARWAENLTLFLEKRQLKLELVILDALLKKGV